ncbi:hypothetical protein [Flavilitoribacter nigricans]|uniref:Uncharacterized protein n=1 Tax=Flavilitoribacter nigricans (strain ATCC 23147 / DSM 23189 / NBRC 102662 / NCIMB 1420 / SS-2) TaxID=1122177 RepID=A0A2D0N4Y0_FLAN2|nr:hypothetical protein [Flavilitoribacter nigricans]PHN03440.1 hypothetical protein CRP01_27550 [Flavilitoribacter nigricans DSM 23189 = NBRC 102662]
MTSPPSSSIKQDTWKYLTQINRLESAPKGILSFLRRRKLNIPLHAWMIPSLQNSDRIYIIYKGNLGVNIFTIDRFESEEIDIDEEELMIIEVNDITPTISDDLNDYPIFRTGTPYVLDGIKKFFIDGKERRKLSGTQLNKWDYFFRLSKTELARRHKKLIEDFKTEKELYHERRLEKFAWFFLILAGVYFCYYWTGILPANLLFLICFYKFRNSVIMPLFFLSRKVVVFHSYALDLEKEQRYLQSLVYQNHPLPYQIMVSDQQISQWLNEEILTLDRLAVQELRLGGQIIPLKGTLKSRKTKGLNIEEWGMVQANEVLGKDILEKHYFNHQLGLRVNDGSPMYAIYYIYFIYMTAETIGIYGLFYDFILEKKIGGITNQYYYRDIVSIGTEQVESKILNHSYELETLQIIISFYNDQRISFTLTDEKLIKRLRDQIEAKKQLSSYTDQNMNGFSPMLSPDLRQLVQLADDRLPATRSNAILITVKEYWKTKKDEYDKKDPYMVPQ